MAVVNQYKFVGKDNDTTGNALTVFATGKPGVNETIIIKSILVTSAGTPSVTVLNNSITAIKSVALTANQTNLQSLIRDLDAVITKLNTSFQQEVKQEIEAKSFFLE